jgi:hypothetical protein
MVNASVLALTVYYLLLTARLLLAIRYLLECLLRTRAVRARWRRVLHKLFEGQSHGSWPSGTDFVGGLQERFGLTLPMAEPDCRRQSEPEQGRWH